jgi:iron complex outermembrane receptor protein
MSAALEWELDKEFTLKSISAYRSTEWTDICDADNTPLELITTDVASDSEQFSQEFQVLYDNDKLFSDTYSATTGSASIDGFELEFTYIPSSNLMLEGALIT